MSTHAATSCIVPHLPSRDTLLAPTVQDMYPDVFRFTISLFPSEDDDVITSPYNSMLALSELVDHASTVLPLENQALLDIVRTVDMTVHRSNARSEGQASDLLGPGVDLPRHRRQTCVFEDMDLRIAAARRKEALRQDQQAGCQHTAELDRGDAL